MTLWLVFDRLSCFLPLCLPTLPARPLHSHIIHAHPVYTVHRTTTRLRCLRGDLDPPPIAGNEEGTPPPPRQRAAARPWPLPHRRPGKSSPHKAKAGASSPPAPCTPVHLYSLAMRMPGLCMRRNARATVPIAYGGPTTASPCFRATPARSLPIAPAAANKKTPQNTFWNALVPFTVPAYQYRLRS